MGQSLQYRTRWGVVVIYAVAMAWVEAAVVYYLRTMVGRIEPFQPNPLPIMGGLARAELVREAATLVMLLTVGTLAGRSWRQRWGFAAIAFGVWDIFYYVFLKLLCGWPYSLFDWDILFLLPLPWWGPVLAPMLISVLLIAWGTLGGLGGTSAVESPLEKPAWLMSSCGVLLALYLFMAGALRVAGQGTEAVRNVLPTVFPWAWFLLALALMSAPVFPAYWALASPRSRKRLVLEYPVSVLPAEDSSAPLTDGARGNNSARLVEPVPSTTFGNRPAGRAAMALREGV